MRNEQLWANSFEENIAIAEESCEWRGHELRDWKYFKQRRGRFAGNSCVLCKKYVQVIENPLPNQIDIGGTAVALNCVE